MRKALYLMGILDDEDVEWLGKSGTSRYLPSGTILIREGVPIEDIYVVLDGKLSLMVGDGQKEIAPLYPGEILGEISFVDSRPPSASVVTALDSHVLVISRALLSNRLSADTAFSARFYKAVATVLADRLRKNVSYLGYGKHKESQDPDELDEALMDGASVGAARFDRLIKLLRIN